MIRGFYSWFYSVILEVELKGETMSKVNVSVSVRDDSLHRIRDVVKQVKSKGMHVERVLENSGVLTGSVDSDDLVRLNKVKGVSGVEKERSFQIAPPDSDVQ
jgi:hypothetical protein